MNENKNHTSQSQKDMAGAQSTQTPQKKVSLLFAIAIGACILGTLCSRIGGVMQIVGMLIQVIGIILCVISIVKKMKNRKQVTALQRLRADLEAIKEHNQNKK